MGLAFGSFPVIVGLRYGTVLGRDMGGYEACPEKSAVIAFGPVVVPADAAGISGCGGKACDAGETVGAVEGGHVAAGRGDELGGEQRSEPGDTDQEFRVRVVGETVGDLLVDRVDVVSEGEDLRGEFLATICARMRCAGTTVCWLSAAAGAFSTK